MSKAVLVVQKADLAPDEVCKFDVSGGAVAVYNLAGAFYATADGCTHARASLSDGVIVDDALIECPVHGGTFHIPSGRAVGFPCVRAVRTYKVTDLGDRVEVDLEQEAEEAAKAI